MKKMLPLFLAALVGLASCSKKDENQPQTKTAQTGLQGRWEGVTIQSVEKTPAGATVRDETKPLGPDYFLEITPSEFNTYSGTTLDRRLTYTLTGTTMRINSATPYNVEIKEQTNNRLVLGQSLDYYYPNTVVVTTTFKR
jgi:hypothetical protein